MNATVIPFRSEDDAELRKAVELQLARSAHLTITTAEDYEQAADVLKGLAAIKKQIGEFFDDDIAAAHKIHKSLTTKRKAALDEVDRRDGAIRLAMGRYLQEQERIRREAELAAQAAARKAEEERLAREAAALEAAGEHALAEQALTAAIEAPAPVVVVPSTVPKVAGVAAVETFDFEVVNLALVPREYLKLDEVKVRGVVRSLKDATRIPGIRVVRRTGVRVSA